MDQQKAKEIAKELLNSGQTSDQASFTVTSNDQATGEVIVIVAIKTDRRGEETVKRLAENIATKAVAGPKGTVCPVCNGTGRV
jgi:hypothetical protein